MVENNPEIVADKIEGVADDAGLRQFVGYHIKRAYNVVRSDLAKTLEPFGLRITTYSTLILIVENPGIRQSDLADMLDIERPNLVMILDDLEQRHWIRRERVPTDRRAYALVPTPQGKRTCAKAVAADRAHEERVFASLSADQRAHLIRLLNRVERGG